MDATAFHKRFIAFCELNHPSRTLETRGEAKLGSATLSSWQKALDLLLEFYHQAHERVLVERALADPYFPLSMLRKLNLEEIRKEPKLVGLSAETLGRIAVDHLLSWAEIFLHIRQDLTSLNGHGQVSSMRLLGSPLERLPKSSWCDYCGGCCEIRGGPPEFTGNFPTPQRWSVYFRGDGCRHQRFCPFLFEYFATGRFFCSIYRVKPKCCWAFDRDECDFLKKEVAGDLSAKHGLVGVRS